MTEPPDRLVTWSIKGEEPGVEASIDPTSGLITVDDNSEEGWFTVRATDAEEPCSYKDEIIYVGCPSCSAGQTMICLPGNGAVEENSVDFRLRLGVNKRGQSAGNLYIKQDFPSAELATPRVLQFSSLSLGVDAVFDFSGGPRQISAPQTFVDVVTDSPYKYTVNFYDPAAKGELVAGIHDLVPGATPFVSWQIENPDASADTYNRLRMTKLENGSPTKVYEYAYIDAQNQWSLTSGGGSRIETVITEYVGTDRTVRRAIKDGSDHIASHVQTTYRRFPWGEEMVAEVVDPDGDALTTQMTFHEDAAQEGSYGKLASRVEPDGSWVRYEYDGQGRKALEVRSWLDAPAGSPPGGAHAIYYDYTPIDAGDGGASRYTRSPRTVTEQIEGTVVSKTFHAYLAGDSDERIEIVERCVDPSAVYGAPDNQRTVTTYYASGTGLAQAGRVKSVVYPDGRMDTYSYENGTFIESENAGESSFLAGAGVDERETVIHGTEASPAGIAFKTTMTISMRNRFGHGLMQETYVYNGSGYDRIQWTVQHLDDYGRVTASEHSDGTRTDTTWACCGKESETNAQGVTYAYTYDALGRMEYTVKKGATGQQDVTIEYGYDAVGRQLSETSSSGGLSQGSSSQYDLAGRVDWSRGVGGLMTDYNYQLGGIVTTVVRPGGATEVTRRYVDGRIKSVTGTAVVPRFYTYGVNADGTQWTRVHTGNADSPMWEQVTVDMIGRTVRTERPGYASVESSENFYNDNGYLIRTSTAGQADTLFEYDGLGDQTRSGLDVDASGVLEPGGMDRISDTNSTYTLVEGDWWQQTEQRVYPEDNDGTPFTLNIQRARLTGLGVGGLTSETVSVDVHGNHTVQRQFIDRAAKTTRSVTDYPDSTIDQVTLTVNGLFDH